MYFYPNLFCPLYLWGVLETLILFLFIVILTQGHQSAVCFVFFNCYHWYSFAKGRFWGMEDKWIFKRKEKVIVVRANIYQALTMSRHYAQHWTSNISFNPQKSQDIGSIIIIVYR